MSSRNGAVSSKAIWAAFEGPRRDQMCHCLFCHLNDGGPRGHEIRYGSGIWWRTDGLQIAQCSAAQRKLGSNYVKHSDQDNILLLVEFTSAAPVVDDNGVYTSSCMNLLKRELPESAIILSAPRLIFFVILPGMDEDEARLIGKNIEKSLEQQIFFSQEGLIAFLARITLMPFRHIPNAAASRTRWLSCGFPASVIDNESKQRL